VTMPKFSVDYDLDAAAALEGLGIQQAFLRVDEDGTTAGAFSVVVVGRGAAPPDFVIDRPFLLVVRDAPTGAVPFRGRYSA